MLAGRDRDVAWLTAVPPGSVLLLTGAAGVGKSRLVEAAFADRVSVTFPRARHPAPGHGLRSLLADLGVAPPEPVAAERPVAEAAARRPAIFRAVREALAAHPVTVVLDDAQWADELTVAWLAQCAPVVAATRARIVVVVRAVGVLPPPLEEALVPLRRAGVLATRAVEPLDLDGVAELATGLDAMQVARLHAATGGLPLAVQELLHRGGDAPATTSGDSLLARLVREDVDELSNDARDLVHAAAVAPQPASESLLRDVLVLPPERYDVAVAEAERAGLLSRGGPGRVGFRHELYRECVQATLPLADRRRLHRAVAEVLAAAEDAPARLIAAQLLDAGAVLDAVPFLERACDAAIAAHDLGNAFSHLRTAIEACPPEAAALRARLAERAVVVAVAVDLAPVALDVVTRLLDDDADPALRGRLLLCLARLATYAGDFPARVVHLGAARQAFTHAGDDAGVALSLGELALPVAGVMPLHEHVRIGREGVRLAERTGDPRALVLCAGNLAAAEIMTGNDAAFALWERAAAVAPTRDATDVDVANRTMNNWLAALIAHGRYDDAQRLARDLRDRPRTDPTSGLVVAYDALVQWRLGRWTEASRLAATAAESGQVTAHHLGIALQAMVSFERDRRPDVTPLETAARFVAEDQDELWSAPVLAWLMLVRAARREPHPQRGLRELVRSIVASESAIGWEDLLVAAAQVDPTSGRTLLALPLPSGRRAGPSIAFARGLLDRSDDLLLAAANGFEELGERYVAARALVAAANVRRTRGRNAGDLRVRAAEMFRDLGADRSLATLLRKANGTRALDGFRVPAGQRFAGAVGLTERERQVADLARWGLPAREVAATLGIAESTVRTHLERVKEKLGARRTRDLVRLLGDPVLRDVRPV